MNQYQYLKWAVIGLTTISRASAALSSFKPELRIITYYTEPTKQVLIQSGNALWNYELSQQIPPQLTSQPEQDFILINYERN